MLLNVKNDSLVVKFSKSQISFLDTRLTKVFRFLIISHQFSNSQFHPHFENILSPSHYGFRKLYSTQYCLLVVIEKLKEAIDIGNTFGAVLTVLSKAFECLDCPLLAAKLHWYGLLPLSLKLMFSYSSNYAHHIKMKESLRNILKIEYSVA